MQAWRGKARLSEQSNVGEAEQGMARATQAKFGKAWRSTVWRSKAELSAWN